LFLLPLAKYQQYRHAIKSIRDREDRLSDIREKKRTLSSRITNLTKTSPKSPKLRELEKELGSLDRDTHDTELEMGDFKRFALKEAFYLRFNAMNEYAEKTAMIAGFGKYIVDLLDIAPSESKRRTYDKGIEAAMIFADAINAVEAWQPQEGDERPTIAANTSKHQGTDATRVDDEPPLDTETTGKGKQPLTTSSSSPSQQEEADDNNTPTPTSTTPPRLPPRSPVPSHHEQPITSSGPATGDHKSLQRQDTQEDLDQLDLYDAPPPAYQPSPINHHEQPNQHDQPTPVSYQKPEQPTRVTLHDQPAPTNKEEEPARATPLQAQPAPVKQEEQPTRVTLHDQPAPVTLQDQPVPVKQDDQPTPITLQDQPTPVKQDDQPASSTLQDQPAPVKQDEQPTPVTPLQDQPIPVKQEEQQQQQKEDEASNSPRNSTEPVAASVPQEPRQSIPDIQEPAAVSPSLPPAPSFSHARPITHEDKEEIDDGGFESPYQSHNTISTPSTPQYQQSPLPMHQQQYQPSPAVSYHQPHSNSTMSWTVPYGGVEPQYHHGQYQQLYDQLTERQQQRPVQRPYSEFQQQYVRPDVGGFRVPTPTTSAPLSAEDEKRRLAERYAMEETQARKASIQTLQQQQKPDPKKSVILPEGEHHGYKPSPRK
jgi:hypothetical protein